MARRTILEIVTEAMNEIGLPGPNSLTTSTDDLGSQLKAIANTTAEDIIRRCQWQKLTRSGMISTAAEEDQGDIYGYYPDFRGFVNDTLFNETLQRKLWGPVSAQEWTAAKNGNYVMSPEQWWRMRDDSLLLYEQSTAGETVTFEYWSNAWLKKSAAEADRYTSVQADTNICLLHDTAFKKGVQWRWKHAKGLDYAESFRDYETFITSAQGTEKGAAIVSLNPYGGISRAVDPYPFDVTVEVS